MDLRHFGLIALAFLGTSAAATQASGPLTLTGQSGTVIEGLHITSTAGDCVALTNSDHITIRNSEIGPCGANGIRAEGGGSLTIVDSYIHPDVAPTGHCCDTHDGIYIKGAAGVLIQGNVVAYGESNIVLKFVTGSKIIGNFLLNPQDDVARGQNVLYGDGGNSDILVDGNYTLSSTDTAKYRFAEHQQDSLNFEGATGIVAQNNYVTGGQSPSGCGIIADGGANNAHFLNNIVLDTGQCGIGIADGVNHIVDGNRVWNRNPVPGGGNTAIYVWWQYLSNPACGDITISNNLASEIKPDGVTESGSWDGGNCGTVAWTGNTWDAAARALMSPPQTKMAPPAIPPHPFACAAVSPYTNQTSTPSCDPATVPPPVAQPPSTALPAAGVRVHPNPYRKNKTAGPMYFDQLPSGAAVKLFTVSGHLVKSLTAVDTTAVWDLTNNEGASVASGLYIYSVTDAAGHNTTGKLAIIK